MAKSDIEIAREANMQPIAEVGEKLGIPAEHLQHFGPPKPRFRLISPDPWRTGRKAS